MRTAFVVVASVLYFVVYGLVSKALRKNGWRSVPSVIVLLLSPGSSSDVLFIVTTQGMKTKYIPSLPPNYGRNKSKFAAVFTSFAQIF